ncbi:HTD2 family dehydratase [Xanthobacter wiegelii]|uniref:FAS1-like dehydratase domain-containing protein n=1 Tax=Xanthobacter wiegelii TaxID=3119913 RepID=UPI00372AB69D
MPDIARLQAWVGRTEEAEEEVTAALVRRFRATFDEAPGDPRAGEAAPLLLHWCLTQPAVPTGALGADGHPARGGFLPPVPLPRRMWAGGRLAFAGDIGVGDLVRRLSTVDEVSLKEGRSGALCFVTVRHEITCAGRVAITETQNIVYRAVDTAAAGKAPEPAPEGRHRRAVDPSAAILFRYSALTFNGHRIHYDQPYVTGEEGYPGLVVHGPLQATWLARFAAEIGGAPPTGFSFRGLSPVFGGVPLVLHAEEEGSRLKLWTSCHGGPVAMSAEAEW